MKGHWVSVDQQNRRTGEQENRRTRNKELGTRNKEQGTGEQENKITGVKGTGQQVTR